MECLKKLNFDIHEPKNGVMIEASVHYKLHGREHWNDFVINKLREIAEKCCDDDFDDFLGGLRAGLLARGAVNATVKYPNRHKSKENDSSKPGIVDNPVGSLFKMDLREATAVAMPIAAMFAAKFILKKIPVVGTAYATYCAIIGFRQSGWRGAVTGFFA